MFGPVKDMIARLKKVSANTLSVSVFIQPEIKTLILRLNRVDQLYSKGVTADDQIIGVYSFLTGTITRDQTYTYQGIQSTKKYGERFTLYDTGEFYESFRVVVTKTGFIITADAQKPDKDLMEYGELLGLTPESRDELSEKMLPLLRESLRKTLLG